MAALAVAGLALSACGDDHDHTAEGDGDHAHDSCGLQENCSADAIDPTEGVITIAGEDGNFSVMIHEATALSTMNEWTIMVMDADGAVAGADVTAYSWSVDCMHKGPTPDQQVTTGDDGMAAVELVAAHGGPWNAVFEIEADGVSDTVTVELCVPGASHGDDTMHDAGS